MTVRVSGGSVVVRNEALESAADAVHAHVDQTAFSVCRDAGLTAVTFSNEQDRRKWLATLQANGMSEAVVDFDAAVEPVRPARWLVVEKRADGDAEAWLLNDVRSEPAPVVPMAHPPIVLHEVLSRSESGLHYVRDRRSGILRRLTDEEMRDLSEPTPCQRCGEQFGCEHYNCAGEALLTGAEVAVSVPPEWLAFAREAGVSREDIERLRSIEEVDGGYRLAANATTDMRAMELVLLLNESL